MKPTNNLNHSLPCRTSPAPHGKEPPSGPAAEGGHPGNTLAYACVRRWIAPRDGSVSITGSLKHEPEQGDGVGGFILSSRQGELKRATVHHSKVEMSVAKIIVKAGETLD